VILTVSVDGLLLPAAFNCLGLIGQNHACVNRPIGRLGIEPFDHGEKESVDIGEQAAVVPKVWA